MRYFKFKCNRIIFSFLTNKWVCQNAITHNVNSLTFFFNTKKKTLPSTFFRSTHTLIIIPWILYRAEYVVISL